MGGATEDIEGYVGGEAVSRVGLVVGAPEGGADGEVVGWALGRSVSSIALHLL